MFISEKNGTPSLVVGDAQNMAQLEWSSMISKYKCSLNFFTRVRLPIF